MMIMMITMMRKIANNDTTTINDNERRPHTATTHRKRGERIVLTLYMLLVAKFANAKWCKKSEKWLKPWQMGTHLKVLGESFPMNTNMTGFRWSSKYFASLRLERK